MKEACLLRRIQPAQRDHECERQLRNRGNPRSYSLTGALRKASTVSLLCLHGVLGLLAGVPC